jgi:hypothetical protein
VTLVPRSLSGRLLSVALVLIVVALLAAGVAMYFALHHSFKARWTGASMAKFSASVMLCMSLPMVRCPFIQSPMGHRSIGRIQGGTGRPSLPMRSYAHPRWEPTISLLQTRRRNITEGLKQLMEQGRKTNLCAFARSGSASGTNCCHCRLREGRGSWRAR